jgi:hypothetical protein
MFAANKCGTVGLGGGGNPGRTRHLGLQDTATECVSKPFLMGTATVTERFFSDTCLSRYARRGVTLRGRNMMEPLVVPWLIPASR